MKMFWTKSVKTKKLLCPEVAHLHLNEQQQQRKLEDVKEWILLTSLSFRKAKLERKKMYRPFA